MLKFSKTYLKDRIYACWLGKNIGGTMGTPYEGNREMQDISGFSSPPGVVLPNDDLDLQLVWLKAMDDLGPEGIDAKVLAEYWLSYIGPNWNEYGVGKSNLREGLLPPLSGEVNNEEWKHSNGAWIRTEIWACLFPGQPDKAIAYAFEDACVDHGFGEGTYAAIFIAAIESAAFVVHDIQDLIDIGLSKIPEDCQVARSVRLVREGFEKGVDWKKVRNDLVEDSSDLGWFQAPANVAFVILGLLYGKGDFKQSMILAINCGDDTDCTGATIGALMGIIKGGKGIPEDWLEHIGDDIITISVKKGHNAWPENCTQLTECVMNLLPVTTRTPLPTLIKGESVEVELVEDDNDFSEFDKTEFCGDNFVKSVFFRSPYSFKLNNPYAEIWVEFDAEPRIMPGGSLSGRISASIKTMPEQKHFHLRWLLPEGWNVTGRLNLHANAEQSQYKKWSSTEFTLTVAEDACIMANNRLILDITCPGRALPILIPIIVLG